MPRFILQLYEIQTPAEAEAAAALGVDHIGTVLMAEDDAPSNRQVGATIAAVRRVGACSSLIPLFSEPELVMAALAELRPDIVHFCQAPGSDPDAEATIGPLIALQNEVRRRFPAIRIMRSIPVGPPGRADRVPSLALAARFAPVSDLFLIDTLLDEADGEGEPVAGFVGITGRICDRETARRLVMRSPLPVILAGGIGPCNAAEGLRRVRPCGIDSCTATNAVDARGLPVRFRKDFRKVARLAAAVRRAEQELA